MAEAGSPTLITWNVTNWVTVVLMVIAFYAVLALGSKLWKNRKGA